jgi:3-hydroxyisobutyrate dehydrogenase-like beta-hydroxyacid dehydrogenase
MVEQMFGALTARGRGGWDHSALITVLEGWAGQEASYSR